MSSDSDDGYPLKRLADSLGRRLDSLTALADGNDPYMAGRAGRRKAAEWFARLFADLFPGARDVHVRRVHYKLISQNTPVVTPNVKSYENTEGCSNYLGEAARDARYLGLISGDVFVDRRNPEPIINFDGSEDYTADVDVIPGEVGLNTLFQHSYYGPSLTLPRLELDEPQISQRYQIEVWCEKSTMNDILMPLCRQYGVNFVYGIGETSAKRCEELVARACSSGRPVRILYISDFDPGGQSMPLAAARKMEFEARKGTFDDSDLDIQLIPIALTYEQCVEYQLPRIPLKETEVRAKRFEERFGEGATELDALEALHPGELERIVRSYIERYYDDDLDDNVQEVVNGIERDLDTVKHDIRKRYADKIAALEKDRKAITEEVSAELARVQTLIDEKEKAFEERARPILKAMESDLEDEALDPDQYDWPEPAEGDEVDDPLFDSTRSYLDQIERYHRHQGKVTIKTLRSFQVTCIDCGKGFTSARSTTKFCPGGACWARHHRKLKARHANGGSIDAETA